MGTGGGRGTLLLTKQIQATVMLRPLPSRGNSSSLLVAPVQGNKAWKELRTMAIEVSMIYLPSTFGTCLSKEGSKLPPSLIVHVPIISWCVECTQPSNVRKLSKEFVSLAKRPYQF